MNRNLPDWLRASLTGLWAPEAPEAEVTVEAPSSLPLPHWPPPSPGCVFGEEWWNIQQLVLPPLWGLPNVVFLWLQSRPLLCPSSVISLVLPGPCFMGPEVLLLPSLSASSPEVRFSPWWWKVWSGWRLICLPSIN